MKSGRKIWAVIWLLVTVIGWGIMYPASKDAATKGIDGYYLASLRYVPGAMLVSTILFMTEGKKAFALEGKGVSLWLFGTIGFAGLNLLSFVGISLSSAEHAAIILALMPMMSLLTSSVIERVRPSNETMLYALMAFFGIFLVITKGSIAEVVASSPRVLMGDLLLLAATACWVVYTYFARSLNSWSPLRVTALSSALGTCSIVMITMLLTEAGIARPPEPGIIRVCLPDIFILVATTAVIVSWNAGIKGLGPVNGVLFVNLVPVITFAIGAIEGHRVTETEVVGSTITLLALVASNIHSRFRTRRIAPRMLSE